MKSVSKILIVFSDLVSFCLAAASSLWLYNSDIFGLSRLVFVFRMDLFIGGLIIYLVILINNGSYRRSKDFTGISRLVSLVNGTFVLGVVYIALIFSLQLTMPTTLLVFFMAFLPIYGIITRLVMGKIESKVLSDYIEDRVLIYGAGDKGVSFVEMSERMNAMGLNIIGFVDDRVTPQKELGNPKQVLGTIEDLEGIAVKESIDRIIVAIRNPDSQIITRIKRISDRLGVTMSFLPTKKLWEDNPFKIRDFSGIPLADARLEEKPFYDFVKRFVDIILSLAGLLLASPLFIGISVVLKIKNDGPVFFKHKRTGIHGTEFTMVKFRTMYSKSNPYEHSPASSKDQRLTPIGKWLRRTSLDELPQLFNVLFGQMSMVGPRPEMPFIVDQYENYMKRRLLVKPGITGLWQISKARTTEIHDNPEYDLHYVENRSLALDFIIILMTVVFVVRSFTH